MESKAKDSLSFVEELALERLQFLGSETVSLHWNRGRYLAYELLVKKGMAVVGRSAPGFQEYILPSIEP